MDKTEYFLRHLQEQFVDLELALKTILKEERELHDDFLIRNGFIVHSYRLNYKAVNFEALSEILSQLEKALNKELQLQKELETHSKELDDIESDYEEIAKKKLHTNLLAKYLNETFHYCKLMITRIKQLIALLQEGITLHKKSLPKKTELFFASFDNIGTKILRFVKFLEQLTQRIVNFEKDAYYPEPRTYGRAMTAHEYKKTLARKKLSARKDPVPVFDAPRSIKTKIATLSKDQAKDFFGQIGVVGVAKVLFFETRIKPINHDNPITQSNGLREYKFPKNIGIEILEAA